jgi:hypothetical protein
MEWLEGQSSLPATAGMAVLLPSAAAHRVHGAADDTPQGVPGAVIEPARATEQRTLCSTSGGAAMLGCPGVLACPPTAARGVPSGGAAQAEGKGGPSATHQFHMLYQPSLVRNCVTL